MDSQEEVKESNEKLDQYQQYYSKVFRPFVSNPKIGKKNIDSFVEEQIGKTDNDVFKKHLLKLKKGASI